MNINYLNGTVIILTTLFYLVPKHFRGSFQAMEIDSQVFIKSYWVKINK